MGKKVLLQMMVSGCILALIGGCAPTDTNNSGRVPVIYISEAKNPNGIEQAEILFAKAKTAKRPNQALLNVAILFAKNGNLTGSNQALQLVKTGPLSDEAFTEYSLLSVELRLQEHGPKEALSIIENPRFVALQRNFEPAYQRRILSIRSDINHQIGRSIDSINDAIGLASLLDSISDKTNVHNKIWRQLAELPYLELQQCSSDSGDVLAGWCELGRDIRLHQNNHLAVSRQLKQWKNSHKSHPAALVTPSWFEQTTERAPPVTKIAILLPLQGHYKSPSNTFLSGFMEAFYGLYKQNNLITPQVRIQDTSIISIEQAYNNAIIEGADVIIGGIRQSEAAELYNLTDLKVPTISLNRIKQNKKIQHINLLQFGSAQYDEMIQIADRAWIEGHRSVLVIAPGKKWGQESAQAFSDYWQSKGGRLIESVFYDPSVKDFTQFLKPSLNIDLSENRGREIRRFVNSQVIIKPRRRQDIDFALVLGYPERARQIKPALDFLYAADLPVYSSSNIYNGLNSADSNRDLSGIQFTAMPWTMPGHLISELSSNQDMHTTYRHLYATGYDTFLVYRQLVFPQPALTVSLFGATGILKVNNGVISRKATWSNFHQGIVRSGFP
ncbi:MAG: penicillin-binding protein activator [Porticoccaceae bacterium]|nr:penicillin-binding protein activator [Porticoccaceae bacterium]